MPTNILELDPEDIDLEAAASQNRNGFVAPEFSGHIEVLQDHWGIGSAKLFFPDSDAMIVAQNQDAAMLRAASLAVQQRVPMVVYDASIRSELSALMEQFGVHRVLLVGEVPISRSTGAWQVIQDPGTTRAMGDLTAFQPQSKVVGSPEAMVKAIAEVDPSQHVELKAAWQPLDRFEDVEAKALPAQSRRDGQMAPVVVASPVTPVPAVANARAYGATVRVMPSGNPLDSKAAFAMVAGLEDGPLVALGPEFGDEKLLGDRIRQGWAE